MSIIIAVVNHKGGVAKSTTAAAIMGGLQEKGCSALAIDLDPQCNLSLIMGADTKGGTIFGALTEEVKASDIVQHTAQGDIIAGSKSLAAADATIKDTGKEYRLKEALEPLAQSYDYIVIDTPPALGVLTVNALTAATDVVIPAQADILSLQGIDALADTIKVVRKYCNRQLKVRGILLTRYNPRSVLTAEVTKLMQAVAKRIGVKLYTATIREAIAIKEAQIQQQSLFTYAPKAKVTADYRAFIEELQEDIQKG